MDTPRIVTTLYSKTRARPAREAWRGDFLRVSVSTSYINGQVVEIQRTNASLYSSNTTRKFGPPGRSAYMGKEEKRR
jgi:hypothetical protein